MLARIADKDLLEVRTADGQHDLVRLQQLAVAGQRHVDQVAAIVQVLEACGNVVLEVVPAQRKLVVHDVADVNEQSQTKTGFFSPVCTPGTRHKQTHAHTLNDTTPISASIALLYEFYTAC